MELSELNLKLRSISDLPVVEVSEDQDSGSFYQVRKITDELYLRVEFYKDSYGGSELLGLQFVKPKEIKVTKFESI